MDANLKVNHIFLEALSQYAQKFTERNRTDGDDKISYQIELNAYAHANSEDRFWFFFLEHQTILQFRNKIS